SQFHIKGMSKVTPSDIAVIILAAGKGTRMKSSLPKVLHPIGGKPMLAHVLDTAATLSSHPPVVVIGPNLSAMKEHFPHAVFAMQEEQLGTAHAVKSALPYMPSSAKKTVVLYADTPLVE